MRLRWALSHYAYYYALFKDPIAVGLDSSSSARMHYDRVMALPQYLPKTGDLDLISG